DDGLGLRQRNRVALTNRLLRLARHDVDVLEAESRARADTDDRVLRQRLDGLVELQVKQGDRLGLAVLGDDVRLDVRDDADAEAAWSPRACRSRHACCACAASWRPGSRMAGPRRCGGTSSPDARAGTTGRER